MCLKKRVYICLAVIVILVGVLLFNYEEKNSLHDAIESKVLIEEMYTPATWEQYELALEKAKKSRWNVLSSKVTLSSSTDDLLVAIEKLGLKPDKTNIKMKYKEAIGLDQDLYIPNSAKNLSEAIVSADNVINDVNATGAEVEREYKNLTKTIKGMEYKPDKTNLYDLFNKANNVDLSLYLSSSILAFNEDKSRAERVLNNANATCFDVDTISSSLSNSFSLLELKPDKTQLKKLYSKATSLKAKNYTTKSYNALKEEISNALAVLEDEEATKDMVNDAKSALNTKIKNLKKSTKTKYSVSIYAYSVYENHVGHSWSRYYTYNGKKFSSGRDITVKNGNSVSFGVKIVENDSIPDVGRTTITFVPYNKRTKTGTIYVRENRGRYSGNAAKWKVEVELTVVERL